ncbi:MAG: flavodoxin-dependent (E)-4-hydroxy-3-methylbut-2-enyl-diphosphate synthase [Bacteroidetes bacterium]|nr:flavodoxin-dependent (E)-4-hydroxy-3-methylbut-2-enyl-diphosphate synthase [Bacteroidota bacterium]
MKVGSVKIGGGAPISIQSMTKTDTRNIKATINQIKGLEEVGCEIIRVAVLDEEAARAIKQIKKKIKIPLVADIHFNYRLALEAIKSGADKIRLNPLNPPNPQCNPPREKSLG